MQHKTGVDKRREAQKEKYKIKMEEKHVKALNLCFSTDAGYKTLNYLCSISGFKEQNTPFTQNGLDKDAMLFNEGMRALYISIRKHLDPQIVNIAENLNVQEGAYNERD